MKRVLSLVIFCVGLSGCMMTHLWDDRDNNNRVEDYGTDQVQGFGVVQQVQAPLEAGQLVMQGQQFWYVVNSHDSQYMYKVLSIKRSKPYTVLSEYKTPLAGFPVQLYGNTEKEIESDFISAFCLAYQPENEVQRKQLTELYFKPDLDSKTLVMCRHVRGMLIKPGPILSQNKLSQPFPVMLTIFIEDKKSVKKLLLTPFALATDVLITPFAAVGSGALLGVCTTVKDDCFRIP